MMKHIGISKAVHIRNERISINGELFMEAPELSAFPEFIRSAYKFAGISYPKFYKMDDLCKLALVASELLLREENVSDRHDPHRIGLIIQNSSSTLLTDIEYQRTIDDRKNYFPSPAVFVYTLPNIMLGEVCIKHKFFGENALLSEAAFQPDSLLTFSDHLFEQNRITCCIEGWIELKPDHYEAFVWLSEELSESSILERKTKEINNFYKTANKITKT